MELSEHQGVIALGDQTIQVTIGIDDVEVHLTTEDTEVAKWTHDECRIIESGSGTFLIEAENDSLPFIPRDPTGFARVLVSAVAPMRRRAGRQVPRADTESAPPPKPRTLVGFYALSALTAGLGLWALWTMIF